MGKQKKIQVNRLEGTEEGVALYHTWSANSTDKNS